MIDIIFIIFSFSLISGFVLLIFLTQKNDVDRITVNLQNFLRYFNAILFVSWFAVYILFMQSHAKHVLSTFDKTSFVADLMVLTYISTLIIAFCSNKIRAFCFPICLGKDISKFNNCLLYLRAFSEDKNLGTNRILSCISKYTYGIVSIANPNQVIQSIDGERIYADDSEWKDVVSKAFEVAKLVIINVANTDGCLWEIHKSFEGNFFNKCVFLVTSQDSYNVLRSICYRYTGAFNMPKYQTDCFMFLIPKFDNEQKVLYWKSLPVYNEKEVKQFVKSLLFEFPNVSEDIAYKRNIFNSPLKNLFRDVFPKGFFPFSFAGISILAFPFVAKLKKSFLLLGLPFILLFLVFTIVFGTVNNIVNVILLWAFAIFICIFGKKMMFLSHNWVSEKVINNRLNYMVIIALVSLAIGYIFGSIYVSQNPDILLFNRY